MSCSGIKRQATLTHGVHESAIKEHASFGEWSLTCHAVLCCAYDALVFRLYTYWYFAVKYLSGLVHSTPFSYNQAGCLSLHHTCPHHKHPPQAPSS